MTMIFTGAVYGGSWLLSNSFLSDYFHAITTIGYEVLMIVMVVALLAFMLFLAVAAVNSLALMVKAIFRRKKNDDD